MATGHWYQLSHLIAFKELEVAGNEIGIVMLETCSTTSTKSTIFSGVSTAVGASQYASNAVDMPSAGTPLPVMIRRLAVERAIAPYV